MFVMTIDQRGSRRRGVRVEELLTELAARVSCVTSHTGASAGGPTGAVVLPFERTVGDEVQAVLASAPLVVDLALHLARIGGWSVGVGVGAVDRPLAASARASSGDAFLAARTAVERAKSRAVPVPIAVDGADAAAARDAEAVLQLLGAVIARRTSGGWEVIDALPGSTQREVAARLGISAQAVNQRLRAALWDEEQGVRSVAGRLLTVADVADSAAAVVGEVAA
jgi:hypothetical protein